MAKAKATAKPKRHTHRFSFHMPLPNGKMHVVESKAIVRQPHRPVKIPVSWEHADKALKNHGCGNSQLCAVSTAIADSEALFDHPVIGITDFYSRTCFIASKVNKFGMVTECYRYLHKDKLADRNDEPGELRKLRDELKSDGDQYVLLYPRFRSDSSKRIGKGKRDGSRSSKTMGEYVPRGGNRRFALAALGHLPGIPAGDK